MYERHHDYKWCNTVSTSDMMIIDDMKQNTHVCNLKQSWLIDLFIICWKLLFLCKSWLILLALILLLFNCLNLIYTLLFKSCLLLSSWSSYYLNLLALSTLVAIFLFKFCSYFTQLFLLRSCSYLFVLLILVDLRIFVRIVFKWVNQRKSELNNAWSLKITITEY